MKKTLLRSSILALVMLLCLGMFAGCGTVSKNKSGYWFSKYEKSFVKYDETANDNKGNINEAGTYWKMTVKSDCNISIAFTNGTTTMFSATECKINGTQVKSEIDQIFEYCYKDLNLKKGDKIEFHAFFTNSLKVENEPAEMSMFVVISDGNNLPIEDIK